MAVEKELTQIREALERADADLVDALDARAEAIKALRAIRERESETYFTTASAAEVVQRALERAKHFPREPLERTIREVIGACANMLAPVRVSIPGPAGGFADIAARQHFGSSAELDVRDGIGVVFEDVERKRSSYGVVPFENSSEGTITETIDALIRGEPRICAEVTVVCSYDIVSRTGNPGDVEKVYGTSVAIAECAATVAREFPKASVLDVKSAAVAMDLAREDHGASAIVAGWSEHDGKELRRVKARIEDKDSVETRFVIIGHERPGRTSQDRTILALAVRDEPGSLYSALRPFSKRGINLTRIESRPARGTSWQYFFIIELDGHVTDRGVLTAVEEVRAASRHLKVLGSHPRPP